MITSSTGTGDDTERIGAGIASYINPAADNSLADRGAR